jgi:single-strand DNA-binding protein
VIFNENFCRVAEQYLKKGSKIYVEGQLQTRKYTDQQGVEKFSTEVVLQQFRGELTMLDTRASGESGMGSSSGDQFGQSGPLDRPRQERSPAPARDLDDEVPF